MPVTGLAQSVLEPAEAGDTIPLRTHRLLAVLPWRLPWLIRRI